MSAVTKMIARTKGIKLKMEKLFAPMSRTSMENAVNQLQPYKMECVENHKKEVSYQFAEMQRR
jgi:hypothetical protein